MNSQQMTKIVVKEEVDSEESRDSFEDFPRGAQSFSRPELKARMDAREKGLRVDEEGIHIPEGQDVPERFRMYLAPSTLIAPKMEAFEDDRIPAPSDDRSQTLHQAKDTQELIEKTVLPTLRQFMSDESCSGSTLTTVFSKTGDKTEIKIVVNRSPAKKPDKGEEDDIQDSEVFISPRRHRVIIESEDEGDNQEEEEKRTPKKKSKKAKEDQRTPSTRLRSINLREPSSSEEDVEETQEEIIGDSQTDPDYIPDTQEERGNYWDNRIPRSAPKDPLDLDY
ncbi:Protein CBG21426 [Caenorhabditis briggsae]|uniref:Protein CBG21426 n=1 Tax=Caenorhabditis briggsae TaxID=6238 RepID=A8Y017_CAEBR|nr:Protein CBG21426 [Caenorhabditis briggsae]CAP38234.1 Protein CBG21426 [Caenorhabditis briggsae]